VCIWWSKQKHPGLNALLISWLVIQPTKNTFVCSFRKHGKLECWKAGNLESMESSQKSWIHAIFVKVWIGKVYYTIIYKLYLVSVRLSHVPVSGNSSTNPFMYMYLLDCFPSLYWARRRVGCEIKRRALYFAYTSEKPRLISWYYWKSGSHWKPEIFSDPIHAYTMTSIISAPRIFKACGQSELSFSSFF
jgi:hypothetical protein